MGKREDAIPEVSGDMNTETNQGNEPDDEITAKSFTSTQEAFLQRLLLKVATEMATTHQEAWLRQETELQQMEDKLENLQATQHNKPPTMMKTSRAIRPQDVEYQTLLDTAKRLKEKTVEGAERPPYAYQNRQLASLDDSFTPYGHEPNNDMALTMQTFLNNMGSVLKNNSKNRDSVTELPRF